MNGLTIVAGLIVASGGIQTAVEPTRAGGEQDLTELDVEDLIKIKIATVDAASKRSEKVTHAPSAVTVVTSDDIKRFGWRTLADVLRSLRGFHVTYDRNYNYVGVRGFGRPGDYNSRILLLVDGHQLNDDIFDQAYIGTDFILDLDLVDRIEVVRGPVSALYGGNAFFGVVDVKTKMGRQIGGVQGAASAGSFDTYKARLSWGHEFEKGPDIVASGTWYQSAGPALRFDEFDFPWTNHGRVTNDDDKAPSFFLKAKWFDVTFSAANVNREKGIPTAPFASVFGDRRTRTIDTRTFAEARYAHGFSANVDLMARVFYDQYDYLGYYVYDYGAPGAAWRVVNNDQAHGKWWGIESKLSKRFLDRFSVAGGLELKHHIEQEQRNWDATQIYLDEGHSSTVLAAYGQGDLRLFGWLTFNAALRLDRYDVFGSSLNPRLALIVNPSDAVAFKYVYGRAFRPPNEYELHYRAIDHKPPASLEPEIVEMHEFVYEHYLDRHIRWAATAFYSHIHDLVSFTTDPVDGMNTFLNSGSSRSFGAGGEIEYRSPGGIVSRASYTWQRAFDDEKDEPLTNSPEHMLKAQLSVPLWRERLFLSGEEEFLSARSTLAGGEVDPRALTNVTVLFLGPPKGLVCSASVYNLFDRISGDPGSEEHVQDVIFQDGRTFRLVVQYTY